MCLGDEDGESGVDSHTGQQRPKPKPGSCANVKSDGLESREPRADFAARRNGRESGDAWAGIGGASRSSGWRLKERRALDKAMNNLEMGGLGHSRR
ncbi:hypothetical protein TPAR_04103 [Tolypocladium paradoxum]|uniref:Uncharacterized protein n=1 Tax=Tolypocladium paradoxum TaxID=94208 RepID=A0A2S4KZT0_9HYPO|nr:hypothetical protein TPAR_04103 [Tolypocladium paradoxum]